LTAGESQIELARYRLKQAEESIDEAAFLLQGKKSPRAVINRAYYGMFYAVLALLIFEPYASSKHSGVLGYFNRRFVKTGIFPEELGRVINKAFDLRQRGDYREYEELSYELVRPFVDQSRTFVQALKDYLEKGAFSANP
jgi:uncharacterized protein (UPF0332 family)